MSLEKNQTFAVEVAPLREAVIQDSKALALWFELPDRALYHAIAAFEAEIRDRVIAVRENLTEPAMANLTTFMSNLESGLDAVVHELYRRHGDICLETRPKSVDGHIFQEASRAIHYGAEFQAVLQAIDDVSFGTRVLQTSGNKVSLPYSASGALELHAATSILAGKIDYLRPWPYTILEVEESPKKENLLGILRSSLYPRGDQHMDYVTNSVIEEFCRDLAHRAFNLTEIPENAAIVGRYSVAEFRSFMRVLYRLCAIHHAHLFLTKEDNKQQIVGSLPLCISTETLETELIQKHRLLPAETFRKILEDVTYDVSKKWADIRYQPLLSVGSDRYLIAPTVVTTSNWERNLLKLWGEAYSSRYSAVVSNAKKGAEAELAGTFRSCGFIASHSRRLKRIGGRDADVAVFDTKANFLLLIQIKWLIEPGSSHEARVADTELDKAALQATSVENIVRSHLHEASSSLFDPGHVALDANTRISSAIVGRGHIGVQAISRHGIPVLDFYSITKHLSKVSVGAPLDEVLRTLKALIDPAAVANTVDYQISPIDMAGYRFQIPGFKRVVGLPEPGQQAGN